MIALKELESVPHLVEEVKCLITSYGDYMFKVLNLPAGKASFFKELETFPKPNYIFPNGTFVLALQVNNLIGCAGIRKFNEESIEMKRLFVDPHFRNTGAGSLLCKYVIEWGRQHGFKKVLLDTNVEMKDALILYKKNGFKEIPSYCINENPNPVFMSLVLE